MCTIEWKSEMKIIVSDLHKVYQKYLAPLFRLQGSE